jgi:hypothetical protein
VRCNSWGTIKSSESFRADIIYSNGGIDLERAAIPRFSVVQREEGWFWCSDASWEMSGTHALIGPFEAEMTPSKMPGKALESGMGRNDPSGNIHDCLCRASLARWFAALMAERGGQQPGTL